MIDKTKQFNERRQSQALTNAEDLKKTMSKMEQYEDERRKKFETLIRIAIEFCVEL